MATKPHKIGQFGVITALGLKFRKNLYGFGWEIWAVKEEQRTSDNESYTHWAQTQLLFQTGDEQQFKTVRTAIVEGIMKPGDWESLEVRPCKPRVLALSEKHGYFKYLVTSEAGYREACLHIVKERKKGGWYGTSTEYYKQELEKLWQPTPEELAKVVPALREFGEKQAEEAKRLRKALAEEKEVQTLLKLAIKGDSSAAIKLIQKLNGDQYNNISLEDFQAIF